MSQQGLTARDMAVTTAAASKRVVAGSAKFRTVETAELTVAGRPVGAALSPQQPWLMLPIFAATLVAPFGMFGLTSLDGGQSQVAHPGGSVSWTVRFDAADTTPRRLQTVVMPQGGVGGAVVVVNGQTVATVTADAYVEKQVLTSPWVPQPRTEITLRPVGDSAVFAVRFVQAAILESP